MSTAHHSLLPVFRAAGHAVSISDSWCRHVCFILSTSWKDRPELPKRTARLYAICQLRDPWAESGCQALLYGPRTQFCSRNIVELHFATSSSRPLLLFLPVYTEAVCVYKRQLCTLWHLYLIVPWTHSWQGQISRIGERTIFLQGEAVTYTGRY